MYIKIKLLGYSFHPLLIVYPVVLYTASLVAFVIYELGGELFWFRLGHVASKVGVTLALVTLLPGIYGWTFVQGDGAGEGTVWQWQARATRLAEELEHTRAELAQARDELRQLPAQKVLDTRAFDEPEKPPSWSSVATEAWTAMADQSWFSTPEPHGNPAKLVFAIVLTVGAVALFSIAPSLVGLR